ncbi:MAG: electron transport complex subunit RsxC, partial [Azonexus sp.]|nr:electron transport complex subunit RsxC [Azonexus sp.]
AAKKAAEAAAAAVAVTDEAAAPADVAPSAPVDAEKAAKMATIQAAMARAKAQREAAPVRNTEAVTIEQQRAIDEIEARRVVLESTPPATPTPAAEKAE